MALSRTLMLAMGVAAFFCGAAFVLFCASPDASAQSDQTLVPVSPVAPGRPNWEPRTWREARTPVFPPEPWPLRESEGGAGPYWAQEAGGVRESPANVNRVYCIEGARECVPRNVAARAYAEGARYWLLKGDAELTTRELDCRSDRITGVAFDCPSSARRAGETARDRAMRAWNNAKLWGEVFGAQAGILAQRRIQGHGVQCATTERSLRRIAWPDGLQTNEAISLKTRQSALASLGYYAGEIDGAYGPNTSQAVRGLQRELGYDETGTLTPGQTAHLICHAAQTARDPSIQNVLGVMHATGLGVEQNTDLALEWFQISARRGDAHANFNLAMIYGTQAVLGSYRLCAVIENPERADAYLRQAARFGHPFAERLRARRDLQNLTPETRWERIADALEDAARTGGASAGVFIQWRTQIDRDRAAAISDGCIDASL